MKAILISIKPYWVAKILNGEKTIEIRKRFPKDYVGWVYIYCTKGKQNLYLPYEFDCFMNDEASKPYLAKEPILDIDYLCNGKVVARFWCDNVTEYINGGQWHKDNTFGCYDDYIKDKVCELACVTEEELFDYCEDLAFSVIRISQLEIFDKPKELSEFSRCILSEDLSHDNIVHIHQRYSIPKAPKPFMYLDIE